MVATLLAVLFSVVPAAAQTVRTTVKPETGVVLGQHVRLFVDVLFPGDMPRPPRVTLPEMPGAQILRYETQATTMSDRIDGQTYVGQRFEFALFPRRGGTLDIPAPRIAVLDRAGEETGRVSGTPTKVEVSVPPGVDPSRPVVATREFALEQRWQPEPTAEFKAGDALVRTVTRQAADIPGMAMLDLDFPAPQGVRVYVDPPQTDDRVERGDLTGRRTDRVTYVFEQGGSFPIDRVVQPWWDLEGQRLRQAGGRGVTLSVGALASPRSSAERLEFWLYVATTALGLVALIWWAWPRVRAAHAVRRARWEASEPKAFHDLQAACRHDGARAVYRAYGVWRERFASPLPASFAEELEETLFAAAPWTADQAHSFAARLERHRSASRDVAARPVLPPLNPVP